jgi:hypothetical protein
VRSVEFTIALHVGELDKDGLLHQEGRLRLKPMFCGPGTQLGHAGGLAIGYTFTEAGIALTSAFAPPYLASVKLPSVIPSVALSVVIRVVLLVAQTVARSVAFRVAQTVAIRIAPPVAVLVACRVAFPVALPIALTVAV